MSKKTYKILISTIIFITLILINNITLLADETTFKDIDSLTNEIEKQLLNKNTNICINFKGTCEDEHIIFNTIFNRNAYIKATITKISYTTESSTNTKIKKYTITPEYQTNKKQDKYVNNEIDKIFKSIITNNMLTYEKIKAVNDYIVKHFSYDTDIKHFSDYDLLYYKKSVCSGYAMLTYKMLHKLNIPVLIVTGTANNQSHAWNLVNLNGNWYHLDTTWNDPIPDRKEKVSYDYFMLTDTKIKSTHLIDKELILPNANTDYLTYITNFNNNLDKLNRLPTASDVNIKIHDSFIDFKKYDNTPVEPYIKNCRTLVPIRAVFTELGCDVSWNNKTRTATIINSNNILTIKPKENCAYINGRLINLDVPAEIKNGRIMVPVRFISEAFNNYVFYDKESRTVIIH